MEFVPFTERNAELNARFLYDGQKVENVYHFEHANPYDAAQMLTLADQFVDWWESTGKGVSPSTLVLQSVLVKSLATPIDPGIEYTAGLPSAGTSAGAQLPNNATLAVKWLTLFRGRSYRGRTYHLGLMETQIVGNTVDSGALAIIKAAYQGLLDGMTVAGHIMQVHSKIQNGVPRFGGLATPIIGLAIDPVVDSQRRRLPGRGA